MTLGIYCAGGFGGVAMGLAKEINKESKRWNEICFIDDAENIETSEKTQVFSMKEFCELFSTSNAEIIIAAGEPQLRELLFEKVKRAGYSLPNLIHPTAQGVGCAEIGEGNIILNLVYISTSGVKIGDNNIFMPFSQVSHDNIIRNHCVIASSATLSGMNVIENRCYIGVGAKIRESTVIGRNAIVGMGAIVVKDVEEDSVVVGMPAKELRKNNGNVFR